MKHVRKGKRKEKGQSLTEVAIALPVILLILAGVLDLGRLYYVTVALTDAAGEGAAYATINPYATDEIIARTVAASGGMVQIEADNVTIDYPVIQAGMPVTVTVEYDFTVATPIINAIVPDGVLRLRGVAAGSIMTGEM
ncbi:MAG: TadE/TadG family type IV pilus assembly protein [Anaerolineae bacterium]